MFQRYMWEDYMVSCVLSHSVLYQGEIHRLRLQLSGQKVEIIKNTHCLTYHLIVKKFHCSPNNRVSCFKMVIIISQAINESVEA